MTVQFVYSQKSSVHFNARTVIYVIIALWQLSEDISTTNKNIFS